LLRTSIESYYDEYSKATPPIDFLNKNKIYKTIILPDSTDQFYSKIVLDKEDVPFGVEISFDGYEQNVFTDFLINDGYYCTVAKNIDAFFNSFSNTKKYFQSKTIHNLYEILLPNGETYLKNSITNAYTSSNLSTLPYLTSSGATSVISFNTSSYSIIDTDPTNQFSIAFTDCQQPSDVSSILDFILYKAKIEEYLGSLELTYESIISNSIQSAKPIMFVVEKYKDDLLIQKFYVPNSGVVNFIDSQVIFGNTYKYVINSLSIVPNLEYNYGPFYPFPSGSFVPEYFQTLVTSNKTLKLVKNEIFTKEVTIYDNPPLAPDVQFYPVLNPTSNENQIQMLLNAPVGSTKSIPILFNKTIEKLFIEKSLKCQDVIDGQLLEYSTDDPPLAFLVHKKKIIPTKYEDFLNSTTTLVNVNNDTYSKVFIDTLEPNIKYYFCFRTIDIHKQLSNPSSIFEVELINDKGTYYPIIKPFEFPKENIEYNSISFEKYIHITPSLLQTTIDEQLSNLTNANTAFGKTIILGPQEDKLWGKKFKLRLRSKTTGKTIDFNLNFDKEHLVSEDEKNRVIT
jgi:hypothetical protein